MVEDILKLNFNIIGVVTPKISLPKFSGSISEIVPFKTDDSLKMAMLDSSVDINNLSTKEFSKLQLAHSLGEDVIVLYDFSKGLNKKELNYFKLLFNKITKKYHKKVILVSRDIDFLASMCDAFAIYNNRVIYYTSDIFDDKLYEYIDMPHIVKFIKCANNNGAALMETVDINELIKDIYRSLK